MTSMTKEKEAAASKKGVLGLFPPEFFSGFLVQSKINPINNYKWTE